MPRGFAAIRCKTPRVDDPREVAAGAAARELRTDEKNIERAEKHISDLDAYSFMQAMQLTRQGGA